MDKQTATSTSHGIQSGYKPWYSILKANEVLIRATTWINPKNILLNERNQTQRIAYCVIYMKLSEWRQEVDQVA